MASLPLKAHQSSHELPPASRTIGNFYRNSPVFGKTDLKAFVFWFNDKPRASCQLSVFSCQFSVVRILNFLLFLSALLRFLFVQFVLFVVHNLRIFRTVCDSQIECRIQGFCLNADVSRGLRSQSRPSSPIVMAVKGYGSGTEVVLFAAYPVSCGVNDLYLAHWVCG